MTFFKNIIYVFIAFILLSPNLYAEKLRFLVWEGYAPTQEVNNFEKMIMDKYNKKIEIEVSYISDPNDFFDKIRGQEADLITPTHNLVKDQRFNFIKKNLILPVDLKNIPNYKDIIKDYQNADYITENGKVYGVPFIHGVYALAYNTDYMTAPDSWNVLWEDQYKNDFSISGDYYEVNIYITALSMGFSKEQIYSYAKLNTMEFKNRLRSLAKNAKCFWQGVDKAENITGLKLAAVWGFSLPELKKRGEIWKIANPKEGSMGWIDNYVMGYSLKNKPFLKKVAEEWMNFVLSPEFQLNSVVRGMGSAPVNTSIKNKLSQEEMSRFHLNDPDFYSKKNILWPTIQNVRDRNGLKQLWEKAVVGEDKYCK